MNIKLFTSISLFLLSFFLSAKPMEEFTEDFDKKMVLTNTSTQVVPNEIILIVLENLDIKDACSKAILVCKNWKELIEKHLQFDVNLANKNLKRVPLGCFKLNIKSLDLSNNPQLCLDDIANFKQKYLKKIFLKNCNLQTIPNLSTYNNLQHCSLKQNLNIDIRHANTQLPTSLKYLDLKNCMLGTTPQLTNLSHLEVLNLTFNPRIETYEIRNDLPTSLKKVFLGNCAICPEEQEEIIDELKGVEVIFKYIFK